MKGIFHWPLVCGFRCKGLFWFRVFGYGLRIADRRTHKALFSERVGLAKVMRIGWYSIKGLMP